MNFKSFLKLVEIQTKVASVIPYLLGSSFVLFYFGKFNWINGLILFLSMIIFDMTTTAINNYMDHIKAVKKEGFGYEEHNAIVRDGLNLNYVKYVIFIMLIISALLGLLLVFRTNIVVLFIGIICFGIGVLYSFGPIPISRTPFGEIFSGLTMGFAITFLSIYVHVYDEGILSLSIINGEFLLSFDILSLVGIFIISLPVICGISNIMLANNICDIEDDIVNKRYTLPIYIGKNKALLVFKALYYIGFISIISGVLFRFLPVTSLITLIVFKPVNDNIKSFYKLQSKKDTFILSVKNFVLSSIVYILSIVIGILIIG
ncbi:MAG: 1,4-dihydroxy-2-naphthoate polyprenyltransferase [Clostridium sp.]